MKTNIERIEFDEDADIFMQCIDEEMNSTVKFGRKRSSDRVDKSNHNVEIANSKTHNGLSPRGLNESIKDFARAATLYLGKQKVTKGIITSVAPYALSHRISFDADFKAAHADEQREEREQFNLARELVKGIDANMMRVINNLRATINYVAAKNKNQEPDTNSKKIVTDLLASTEMIDNPLLRTYVSLIKRHYQ